jgi:hypothetical protein
MQEVARNSRSITYRGGKRSEIQGLRWSKGLAYTFDDLRTLEFLR